MGRKDTWEICNRNLWSQSNILPHIQHNTLKISLLRGSNMTMLVKSLKGFLCEVPYWVIVSNKFTCISHYPILNQPLDRESLSSSRRVILFILNTYMLCTYSISLVMWGGQHLIRAWYFLKVDKSFYSTRIVVQFYQVVHNDNSTRRQILFTTLLKIWWSLFLL